MRALAPTTFSIENNAEGRCGPTGVFSVVGAAPVGFSFERLLPMSGLEYRLITGFPDYRVGNDGSIWTRRGRGPKPTVRDSWRQMKPNVLKSGYLIVKLCADGKKPVGRVIHRLVLSEFVGPCPEGMEACHSPDPDRKNCALNNLRWDTHKANCDDKVTHGTQEFGEDHPRSKLTAETVLEIRRLNKSGISYSKLVDRFGISRATVCQIVRRKTWKHI